ncbi:shufflon system plasmid conjugative transfer pilus tip adhesin PilV [Moorena producens]|uniref:shufflon system plasmid conjugative transfer pilus tip adhesin PilV n=1 Tax=Moorena producens TaxID=1155739 RepID=UPI003C77B51C
MAQKNRSELKVLFKTGAKPSQQDFADFIESTLNVKDDGIENPAGADTPLKITAQGDDEKLLDFYAGEAKTWSINQKSGDKQGLNISNSSGDSRLFIDSSSGNVGIGTTNPGAKLSINGGLHVGGDSDPGDKNLLVDGYVRADGGIQVDGKQVIDDKAGWHRTYGNTGWYNQTYGGGWYMSDSTWIRSIGNKNIYQNIGILRTDGTLQVGNNGVRFVVQTNGNVGIGTTTPGAKLSINGGLHVGGDSDPGDNNLQVDGTTNTNQLVVTGSLSFGESVKQMINLWRLNYGIGIQRNTQYFRTDKNFAWYKGGTHDNGELNPGDGTAQMVIKDGNVGIGTGSPESKLHIDKGRVDITTSDGTGGGGNRFNGLVAWNGELHRRAQLVLSSGYSDLVIASSQVNDNHGSTLTFATYDPEDGTNYRKWVINQGNWGARKEFLEFGYKEANGQINPHSMINDTDTVLTLDGVRKRVGIGTRTPGAKLSINGGLHVGGDSDPGDNNLQVDGTTTTNQLVVTGNLSFGESVKQMINLWRLNYGIGIQRNTQYFRTDKNFAWYKGGTHHNNELNPGDGTVQMVIKDGNVGIGTGSPESKLHIDKGRVDITTSDSTGGGGNRFNGLVAWNGQQRRAQLVLSSGYSDLVIASSQVNQNYGSTLTFATYDPEDGTNYRKWVINQGNWGARKEFLEFGYKEANGQINPHSMINDTDTVLTLDGVNKRVGIGTRTPGAKLEVQGNFKLQNGVAVNNISSDGTLTGNSDLTIPTQKAIKTYADTKALLAGSDSQDFQAKKLTVSGAIQPSVGNTENNGIMFPKDPGGVGFGDAAWIRYYARGGAESMTLEIGTSNDNDDHIALMPGNGNVGIGTTNPGAALEIHQKTNDVSAFRLWDAREESDNQYFDILFDQNKNVRFVQKGNVGLDLTPEGNLSFGSSNRQMINLWGQDHGIGIQDVTQYFRTYKNFAWYKGGTHDNNELNPGTDGTVQMVIKDGNVGIGTDSPEAKLDVSGQIKGGGVLAGIWAAQPLTDTSVTSTQDWEDVLETSVTFTLDRTAMIFCTYSINVQPDGNPGTNFVGTRLVVDDQGYRQSGSHFQPLTSSDSNVNLNGNLVLPLTAGPHTIKLQWMKYGSNLASWSSRPSWIDGFIGGRTLVVMAFYLPIIGV